MATSQSQTYVFSPDQHAHLTPYIAALHASCITLDRMPGPFLPPLTNEKLLPWWKERIAECNRSARVIVLLLPETAPGKKPMGPDLRGLAMVEFSEVETGSFRGRIDALLVDKRYRRQGGAKALVAALEYESAKKGRSLLVRLFFPSSLPIICLSFYILGHIQTETKKKRGVTDRNKKKAGGHGNRQRGRAGLPKVWLRRDRQGAAFHARLGQPEQEGEHLFLQGDYPVVGLAFGYRQ